MGQVASIVAAPFTGGTSLLGLGTKNLLKTPKPPEPTAPPSTSDPAVQQAAAEASQRRSRARGFRSTILSQHMMSPDNQALKETYGS